MEEFLKAEEMCNTNITESKVISILDNMQNDTHDLSMYKYIVQVYSSSLVKKKFAIK